jgi:rare lipoprotein A
MAGCGQDAWWSWPPILAALLLTANLTGCAEPTPAPRYHLGQPYQAGGVWYYPRERFDLNETGLGSVLPQGRSALTTNGEIYDPTSMAGAHPTLQLPAIARLTNLENGLSVTLRINDRGTGNPHRLVEFSPRVGTLLRVPSNAAVQVRLMVLGRESQDATEAMAGAPRLEIAAAPRGAIEVAELPPLPGVVSTGSGGGPRPVAPVTEARPPAAPTRLPETLTQEAPRPGRLMVDLGTFEEQRYAAIQRARLAGLRPNIIQFTEGRTRRYRVEMGPFPSVAEAEAAQDQALMAGVPDARIVVD